MAHLSFRTAVRSDVPSLVGMLADRELAGFLQLTFIPYLTYRGGWRALIESVRVRSQMRRRGIGADLIQHAIELSKSRPCHLVQLTMDKLRPDALEFYLGLGFQATHEGLKLHLSGSQ